MAKRIPPCIKCGSKNLETWDCGYSSFNCGGVKCPDCDLKLNLGNCCLTCSPRDEIISLYRKHIVKEEKKREKQEITKELAKTGKINKAKAEIFDDFIVLLKQELGYPHWINDPEYLIKCLKKWIAQVEKSIPDAIAKLAEEVESDIKT